MAKYGQKAQEKVEKTMHERKAGTLKSGSGKKVTSRKQAIAIGLSEARAAGGKVPAPKKKSAAKKSTSRKTAKKKSSAKKKIVKAALIGLGSIVTVAGSVFLANRMQLLRLPFRWAF
jgi:hypothetical protein